jgi:hypothetical protein
MRSFLEGLVEVGQDLLRLQRLLEVLRLALANGAQNAVPAVSPPVWATEEPPASRPPFSTRPPAEATPSWPQAAAPTMTHGGREQQRPVPPLYAPKAAVVLPYDNLPPAQRPGSGSNWQRHAPLPSIQPHGHAGAGAPAASGDRAPDGWLASFSRLHRALVETAGATGQLPVRMAGRMIANYDTIYNLHLPPAAVVDCIDATCTADGEHVQVTHLCEALLETLQQSSKARR